MKCKSKVRSNLQGMLEVRYAFFVIYSWMASRWLSIIFLSLQLNNTYRKKLKTYLLLSVNFACCFLSCLIDKIRLEIVNIIPIITRYEPIFLDHVKLL